MSVTQGFSGSHHHHHHHGAPPMRRLRLVSPVPGVFGGPGVFGVLGVLGVLALLGVLGNAPNAWAQPDRPVGDTTTDDDTRPWFAGTTEDQRKRAREAFLEGNQLIAIPAYARAADKYREAIGIWDNPAFHYNLAIAQINLLQPTEAYDSLKKAVRHGPEPLGDDKHQQALEYMSSLESQLARVRITCDQPQVLVTLDGKPLFMGPGKYVGFVQPGGHQLVARRDGYNTESQELVASPGEEINLDLRLIKPDQVLTVRKWAAWKPWAVVGVGALFFGASAYLDTTTSADFDQFDADFITRCPQGCQEGQIPPEFLDNLQSARTQQNIARVTYVAGGALLMSGAVLLYVNRERVVRIRGDEESPNRAASISVVPVVTSDSVGIHAGMEF